jgi:2-keto-4-pentenoate hydratase
MMTCSPGPTSAHTRSDLLAAELLDAARAVRPIPPLRTRFPDLTIEDAYEIQKVTREARIREGEVVVGQKIGLTSAAMQRQLGIRQPDFGFITDRMLARSPGVLSERQLISPLIEAEIAFFFEAELPPDISASEVMSHCSAIAPALEVIDSRIAAWDIGIVDTIADNASCGAVVLGDRREPPDRLDSCDMTLRVGDASVTGTGSAVLGDPVRPIAWLARTLAALGERVGPGIVISGAWAKALPIDPGSSAEAVFDEVGTVSLEVR